MTQREVNAIAVTVLNLLKGSLSDFEIDVDPGVFSSDNSEYPSTIKLKKIGGNRFRVSRSIRKPTKPQPPV